MLKPHAVVLLLILGAASLLAACGGLASRPLAPHALDRLVDIETRPDATGEQIYEGRVYALDGRTDPLFRYERRVVDAGTAVTSTHITHDPSGAVVVVQSAVHSRSYALQRADLIHRQTGTSASVVVANGEAAFTLNDGERERTSHERVADPVVAGPTMFGFILAHWNELVSGAPLPIRFAVLERGESLGFVLDRVDGPEGLTVIRMKPTSVLVRLAVAPTYFQFDTASRQILEYTGRVPPLERSGDRLTTLDGRVAYTFRAPAFR
ncbi:MAG TPA: hypothetical protein VKE51_18475 [Vicinamibacterales bacterium]|nr:hypothetical protein [Vicinamibacterales bacterium]